MTLPRRTLLRLLAALPAALAEGCRLPGGTASTSHAAGAPTPLPGTFLPSAVRERRAVWLSYLDFAQADFSSADRFAAWADGVFAACRDLGLNRVIAQVRPFCDALYPSRLFPFSHLCTGGQGGDPGFDPLELLVTHAHRRGLALEAWVNPYRIKANGSPADLAADSPAVLHPDWVRRAGDGLYLAPALPAVRQYIAAGLEELAEGYALDGVQLDDYFYPTTDPTFDAEDYAAAHTDLPLPDWRRQQVRLLLEDCYAAVKAADPVLPFIISPQGNIENNYNQQYLDVADLMAAGDCLDGICPQLYWGVGWQQNGSDRFSFENIAAEWAALPRAAGVSLTFGLGAYRIGQEDGGGEASRAFWAGGSALAVQVRLGRALGGDGYALFRLEHLLAEGAAAEREALRLANES